MMSFVEVRNSLLMESWVNNSPDEGITLNREESEVVVSMVNVTGLRESADKINWKFFYQNIEILN